MKFIAMLPTESPRTWDPLDDHVFSKRKDLCLVVACLLNRPTLAYFSVITGNAKRHGELRGLE